MKNRHEKQLMPQYVCLGRTLSGATTTPFCTSMYLTSVVRGEARTVRHEAMLVIILLKQLDIVSR